MLTLWHLTLYIIPNRYPAIRCYAGPETLPINILFFSIWIQFHFYGAFYALVLHPAVRFSIFFFLFFIAGQSWAKGTTQSLNIRRGAPPPAINRMRPKRGTPHLHRSSSIMHSQELQVATRISRCLSAPTAISPKYTRASARQPNNFIYTDSDGILVGIVGIVLHTLARLRPYYILSECIYFPQNNK